MRGREEGDLEVRSTVTGAVDLIQTPLTMAISGVFAIGYTQVELSAKFMFGDYSK